jgi:predicted RNase H-like HicB family nuclease
MSFTGTVVIHHEADCNAYVATCLENYVASDGRTIDEAIGNLREALELYYEDYDEVPVYEPSFVTTMEVAL